MANNNNHNRSVVNLNSIEKLSGADNYHQWSVLMKAFLKRERLWATIEAPTDGAMDDNPQRIADAFVHIFFSLDKVPLGNVEDELSPEEA